MKCENLLLTFCNLGIPNQNAAEEMNQNSEIESDEEELKNEEDDDLDSLLNNPLNHLNSLNQNRGTRKSRKFSRVKAFQK